MEQPKGRAVDCDARKCGKGLGSGLQGLRPTKHRTPAGGTPSYRRGWGLSLRGAQSSAVAEMMASRIPMMAISTLRSAGGSTASLISHSSCYRPRRRRCVLMSLSTTRVVTRLGAPMEVGGLGGSAVDGFEGS